MISLVVTSIAPPQKILKALAEGAIENSIDFILIGDVSSPKDFKMEGAEFYDVPAQESTGFSYASVCPVRHYARKNIGYLIAIKNGTDIIIETDDDNIPRKEFWNERTLEHTTEVVNDGGWYNVYTDFSPENIWPRGFPLEKVLSPKTGKTETTKVSCPIQQGMADENPDVDAVYRMTSKLPITFLAKRIALGNRTWCPFNSQNTTFYKDAFPLLYLPATCSFRMTDIWRSFVAQRICWENNWHILFHEATVWQERNEHNLLRDFEQEVPGYLHNAKIAEKLESLNLKKGKEFIGENLMKCYQALFEMKLVEAKELELVQAWLKDLADLKTV